MYGFFLRNMIRWCAWRRDQGRCVRTAQRDVAQIVLDLKTFSALGASGSFHPLRTSTNNFNDETCDAKSRGAP